MRVRQLPPDRGGRATTIALTAVARPEDRGRVTAAGFDSHLPNPLDAASLLGTVAKLARHSAKDGGDPLHI